MDSLDLLCQTVPPGIPLAEPERKGLADTTAVALLYYDGEIHPLIGLGFVLLAIAIPRTTLYFAWRRDQKKVEPKDEKKEVKPETVATA